MKTLYLRSLTQVYHRTRSQGNYTLTASKFYHQELTPCLLDFIGEFCGLKSGYLREIHEESSEVAHLLLYREYLTD